MGIDGGALTVWAGWPRFLVLGSSCLPACSMLRYPLLSRASTLSMRGCDPTRHLSWTGLFDHVDTGSSPENLGPDSAAHGRSSRPSPWPLLELARWVTLGYRGVILSAKPLCCPSDSTTFSDLRELAPSMLFNPVL